MASWVGGAGLARSRRVIGWDSRPAYLTSAPLEWSLSCRTRLLSPFIWACLLWPQIRLRKETCLSLSLSVELSPLSKTLPVVVHTAAAVKAQQNPRKEQLAVGAHCPGRRRTKCS